MPDLHQIIRSISPALYRRLRHRALARTLLTHPESFLVTTGYMKSFDQQEARGEHGEPIPWMSFTMVALLRQRLQKDQSVFEFGSGFSTMFLAERAQRVVSVEYDPQWYQRITPMLSENCEVVEQAADEDGDYCRVAERRGEHFDVVIVDGRDRVCCVEHSVDSLSERGVLILDDSQRDRYQRAIALMVERGFRHLPLPSLAPLEFRDHQTSLFYRDGNCFDL